MIDYKLVDVPELGYFSTDKPHPRGELLIKSAALSPGYYKRPELTAAAFAPDGYYRTGDVMAEIEPDHLKYVDRRNNVLKLAQGEFVAIARLEAIYAAGPMVRQIYVYGNSERANLLAVIVPTPDALARFEADHASLKKALAESLQAIARQAGLQSYETPIDSIIETEPFSAANGLLSGIGKLLRPRLKDRYGHELEQRYADLAARQIEELRTLRLTSDGPVIDTVTRAVGATFGSTDIGADAHFTDLGGDSLAALHLATLLTEIFAFEVPVNSILAPTATLATLAKTIEAQRASGISRANSPSVHRSDTSELRAEELELDKFIDTDTLAAAPGLPHVDGEPRTVLLTGANGWLGRFLTLEYLERLSTTADAVVIAIVRGGDDADARARLDAAFDSGDPALLKRYRDLAREHLEVYAGDLSAPDLGLDQNTWENLAGRVDTVVHSGALVNHVLPYSQLFGPNVVGTAELIRLALSRRVKRFIYLSTVGVATGMAPNSLVEDGDIRTISPTRTVDEEYANGYANSKWAGEVLLREANDLAALPVSVFRSGMILAHTRYSGQLNVPDAFTRLILGLLTAGIAPRSFYHETGAAQSDRAHYDGLPVDFVAGAIAAIGCSNHSGFHSYNVVNHWDDGISLDVIVDWLLRDGHRITRIDDYDEWLRRFETALRGLPERQRAQSVLPLLNAYRAPAEPAAGAIVPSEGFQSAVCAVKDVVGHGVPEISPNLIEKYIRDLKQLRLI